MDGGMINTPGGGEDHGRWYVVHSHANGEVKALHHLVRQGFEAYLPRYLKRRRHARRVDWVSRPLFPRYLFVRLDPDRLPWRSIRSTVGVSHVICNGDGPVPVPGGVIEALRAQEDGQGMVSQDARIPFRKNELVRVDSGPLSDQVGLFDCASDEERVFILLDLMGRQVRVRVPVDTLQACG
jgi:transcriptional antiterminator RfaH